MDALISLVYTIIDSVCVCLFLDAFASHRWRDHRFLVGVIVQTILMYASTHEPPTAYPCGRRSLFWAANKENRHIIWLCCERLRGKTLDTIKIFCAIFIVF